MSKRYKANRRARYYISKDEPRALRVRCWCGEEGTYEELFDDRFLDDTCGGLGVLNCRCGGDLCVCHNHGGIECPGCEDCEEPSDDGDLGDDYEAVFD